MQTIRGILFFAFVVVGAGLALAQPVPSDSGAEKVGEPHSFRLTYSEDGFDSGWQFYNQSSEVEFKRLPDLKEKSPLTMMLPELEMGVLWDRTARKLYLDANRNGDLTDDPVSEGVVGARNVQEFRGIHVQKGAFSFVIGFTGYDRGEGQLQMRTQSAWQGEIELAGVKRMLAVPAGPGRPLDAMREVYLGLAPDSEGKVELPVDSEPLKVSTNLNIFIDGHDYKASSSLDESTSPPTIVVSFQEVSCKTVAKTISGVDVLRVQMMRQRGGAVVVDRPSGEAMVPDDPCYMTQATIWRSDDPEICLVGRAYQRTDRMVFGEGLAQSVETNRYGPYLNSRLMWRDRADQMYAAMAVTPGKTAAQPKISIRKGDKVLLDGQLEYG